MPRHYVVRNGPRSGPHDPDAFTVHDDGKVTTYRTGLAARGFESLDDALANYGMSFAELEEVTALPRFSERPPKS